VPGVVGTLGSGRRQLAATADVRVIHSDLDGPEVRVYGLSSNCNFVPGPVVFFDEREFDDTNASG